MQMTHSFACRSTHLVSISPFERLSSCSVDIRTWMVSNNYKKLQPLPFTTFNPWQIFMINSPIGCAPSLVIKRLDYCNAVLSGSPKGSLCLVQLALTMAARLVSKARRTCHDSPLLQQLMWLPIEKSPSCPRSLLPSRATPWLRLCPCTAVVRHTYPGCPIS